MSTAIQVIEAAIPDALSSVAMKAQVHLIQDVMEAVMKNGEHYGLIPGCGDKPALLKPGAEKLCLTFRLDPQYDSTERFVGDHLFVKSKCILYHSTSGRRLGSGEGSCSTKESKYAYRQGSRKCPKCGKDAIIKGREEYGGGWLCFKKKDGCGAKWPDGAKDIEGQSTERVANEDLADQYNTVLKMANKRSLVAAVLNVTAASDIFTQDVEDMPEFAEKKEEAKPSLKPSDILARSEHAPADRVEPVAMVEAGEGVQDVLGMTHQAREDGAGVTPPGKTVATAQVVTQQVSDAPAPTEDPFEPYRGRLRTCERSVAAINGVWSNIPETAKQDVYKTYTEQLKSLTKKK